MALTEIPGDRRGFHWYGATSWAAKSMLLSYNQNLAPAALPRWFAQASGADFQGASRHSMGQTKGHLPERKPRNRLFAPIVDYRTYRLRLTGNGNFGPRLADRLSDIRKQIDCGDFLT